jgi:VanZ family protein
MVVRHHAIERLLVHRGFGLRSPLGLGLLCAVSKLRVFAKYWVPVLAWMALIFYASGDTKSLYHSARALAPLMTPNIQADTFRPVVMVARKCAHSAEFAVLALLLWRALRATSAQPNGWCWRVARQAWLWAVCYGIMDEVHQIFVPTRRPEAWDVFYDAIGGAAGLLALWALGHWRKWW